MQLMEKGVVSVETTTADGEKKRETAQTNATRNTEHQSQLRTPPAPFLPPSTKKYTLVLDLDETLVHYEDNGVIGQFYLRPYAQDFIEEMANHYELVIFTAALQDYADWIIDRLDSNKRITHRLYRQHTSSNSSNGHLKVLFPDGRTFQSWEETFRKLSS